MDGCKVGVLEEGDEVCLGGLLEGHDGGGLEAQVGLENCLLEGVKAKEKRTNLEVLRDFTDQTLEGELADEQLGRLLVATDFTEGDGT